MNTITTTLIPLAYTVLQAILPIFVPMITGWVILKVNQLLVTRHLDWMQKQIDTIITDALAWAESQVENHKLAAVAANTTDDAMRLNSAVVYAQKELVRRQVKFLPKVSEAERTEHLRNMIQSRHVQLAGTFKI